MKELGHVIRKHKVVSGKVKELVDTLYHDFSWHSRYFTIEEYTQLKTLCIKLICHLDNK